MTERLCSLCLLPLSTRQLREGGETYVYCRHCDNVRCPRCMEKDANCTLCRSPEFVRYDGIGPGSIPPPPSSSFRGLFGGR